METQLASHHPLEVAHQPQSEARPQHMWTELGDADSQVSQRFLAAELSLRVDGDSDALCVLMHEFLAAGALARVAVCLRRLVAAAATRRDVATALAWLEWGEQRKVFAAPSDVKALLLTAGDTASAAAWRASDTPDWDEGLRRAAAGDWEGARKSFLACGDRNNHAVCALYGGPASDVCDALAGLEAVLSHASPRPSRFSTTALRSNVSTLQALLK